MTRTRFAPSPTGFLHIGGLRTALYCYLWAKKNGGEYILRIEDTDRTRYVKGSVESLISSLCECGLVNDEGPILKNNKVVQIGEKGPYFQSERLDIYKKYIDKLIEEDKAYYCFCSKDRLEKVRNEQMEKKLTPKYDGKCKSLSKEEVLQKIDRGEKYVIRMKLKENEDVSFYDEVRGNITINTNEIDEQVLIKADGFPTYHFAVVIDDYLMNIDYVIRGEEWLVSTPKHVVLYEYLGIKPPTFVHLPSVLNTSKKKLSKRHDSVAVEDFLKKGYLPQSLINYIALLGWSDPKGREIISLEELCEDFDIKRVNKSGAVFDVEKLNWVNSHYIKNMDEDLLTSLCIPYLILGGIIESEKEEKLAKSITLSLKEKLNYLSEIVDLAKEIFIKADFGSFDDSLKEVMAFETNKLLFSEFIKYISSLDVLKEESIGEFFKEVGKEHGIKGKALFMPIRVAINGVMHGPDLKNILCILGKEEVISRLNLAVTKL